MAKKNIDLKADSKNPTPKAGANSKRRSDGWLNMLKGSGIENRDARVSNDFRASHDIGEYIQRALYRSDGLGKRIVDLLVDDMMRGGFSISGEMGELKADEVVKQEFRRLRLSKENKRGLSWARAFGGAVSVLRADDGGTYEDELDPDKLKRIEKVLVYDRHRVSVLQRYSDEDNPKYGEPEIYQISTNTTQGQTQVHESRLLIWDGIDVDNEQRALNDGWGDSIYQSIWTQLSDIGISFGGSANLIDQFILGILEIENLQDLIAGGEEEQVKKRLRLIDISKSILGSILVSKGEKYERVSASVGGLDKLLDKMIQALSSVSGYPVTVLFGQSPAGLQATGQSDIRIYYDKVSANQETEYRPNLERLSWLLMKQIEGPSKGQVPEDWALTFPELWQPTAKETAETRKINAETDNIYITNNALTADEVANSRFGSGEYSAETELDPAIDRGGEPVPEDDEPDDLDN